MPDRFHIITGGPGSGKSTLSDALENHGYARTLEAGPVFFDRGIPDVLGLSNSLALRSRSESPLF